MTTKGYRLPATHVIHTVGPIWKGGGQGEPDLLSTCYRNSLGLAEEHGLESISFPAISTGVYGYPLRLATQTAISEVQQLVTQSIRLVVFACFDRATADVYKDVLEAIQRG